MRLLPFNHIHRVFLETEFIYFFILSQLFEFPDGSDKLLTRINSYQLPGLAMADQVLPPTEASTLNLSWPESRISLLCGLFSSNYNNLILQLLSINSEKDWMERKLSKYSIILLKCEEETKLTLQGQQCLLPPFEREKHNIVKNKRKLMMTSIQSLQDIMEKGDGLLPIMKSFYRQKTSERLYDKIG